MNLKNLNGKNKEINRIYNENEQLYNDYAHRCGLSSSSLWILYALYETEEVYMQNDIAKIVSLPKQTVNSSISGLIKKGYIELEHIEMTRNGKAVKLTKEGEKICKKFIAPLIEAEESALSNMSKAEVETLLMLLNKITLIFKDKIEKIYKKSARGDKENK